MSLQHNASGQLLMTANGSLADACCCGPSGDCDWELSPKSLVFDCGAQAGAFNVNVLAGSGCAWSASVTSGGAYLAINSGSSGNSSGTIGFSLSSNSDVERTAQITVVTTVASLLGPPGSLIGVFDLTQSECSGEPINPILPPPAWDTFRWSISPGAAIYDCPNQNGFFNVNTQIGGGWAASVISGGSFITIFSGFTGANAGTVQFNIASNPSIERAGQIEVFTTIVSNLGPPGTVIGYFSIAQMASTACGRNGTGALPCNWEVQPQSHEVTGPCDTDRARFNVSTGAGCSWTATVISGGAFISIFSGSSGLSSGTIVVDIAANATGLQRFGQIEVRTGIASAFGPIGELIQAINITQHAGNNYMVIADTGFLDTLFNGVICQGMGASSPAPIWDGTVINSGNCNTFSSVPGFKSWNGFNFQPTGPGDTGQVGIVRDLLGPNDHLLEFSTNPSGWATQYHKAGSANIAGVYVSYNLCSGVPNGNPFSFTVVPIN